MNFFEHQEEARKKTILLVFYYTFAVVVIIFAIYFTCAGILALEFPDLLQSATEEETTDYLVEGTWSRGEYTESYEPQGLFARLWNWRLFLVIASITISIVIWGTIYKISQLARGGGVVAVLLGGRLVDPKTVDNDERMLLNVVEEMAIASGVPVPPVYLLDREHNINAFAAGFQPGDAVVGVTAGSIKHLSRDELQGVIAHEFSHILNGDMRLNIRLMGVLNGILIIGVTGMWLIRLITRPGYYYQTGRSRSSRRDGSTRGDIAVVILLIGAAFAVIGYIGVVFGKLIKSAVSRQREFLADASAVQFTRNPFGLACALKRISTFHERGRIGHPNAEEISHMFFADGLQDSFMLLMATHPPLEQRIQRVDARVAAPGFVVPEKAAQQVSRATKKATPQRTGGFPLSPDDFVQSIGSPQLEHLVYASALIAAMPPVLVERVHEPYAAQAVVYCVLLDHGDTVRDMQLQLLLSAADSEAYHETLLLAPSLAGLGPEYRLPLIDMALPALRRLSSSQYLQFRQNVRALIDADEQCSLFEFTVEQILARHLDSYFIDMKPARAKYGDINALHAECVDLILALASVGHGDPVQMQAAFGAACDELQLKTMPSIEDRTPSFRDGARALGKLALATPRVKERVLAACAASVATDGVVTVEEAELLRAISDGLDCPCPPIIQHGGDES